MVRVIEIEVWSAQCDNSLLNDASQLPTLLLRTLQGSVRWLSLLMHGRHTAKFLKRNHGLIELFIFIYHHLLAGPFANYQTRITPSKVIHTPEGIYGQQEAVDRIPVIES